MKPTHPGAAVNAALHHLYRVTAYAVPCPDRCPPPGPSEVEAEVSAALTPDCVGGR